MIVPTPLHSKMFSHYHVGPTGGHMGEYKTLFFSVYVFFSLVNKRLSKNGL